MAKNLVIVESPTKCRTLRRYLGKDFTVVASVGHIVDLPRKELAVNVKNNFKPKYVIIPGKKKFIDEIKQLARGADNIFLASDPDREGEAIAWHISRFIDNKGKNIYRVLFNEITKRAVLAGINNPTTLDIHKVNAQQARRILDRLVGYEVSPLLWKAIYSGLSAGRVQSVALKLVCEREKQIKSFVPEEYWTITAIFVEDKIEFSAKLEKINGEKQRIPSEEEVNKHIKKLRSSRFSVQKIVKKRKKRSPYPPFVTSTMQLEAAKRLGFSTSRTMRTAQSLYEGVELGEAGPAGLITYMRTDSVRLAESAIAAAKRYITDNFGSNYSSPRRFKNKNLSQDAHEAIRPTDLSLTPDGIKKYLTTEQYKLYDLIYRRFLASQMSDALYDTTRVEIVSDGYLFVSDEQKLVFDGFLRIFPDRDGGKEKSHPLPELSEGMSLSPEKILPKQNFTKPPPRFSEGTLVKQLDSDGIGRPSTYAQIISTLFARKYVVRENKALVPTETGQIVNEFLSGRFEQIFNIGFTADLESKLDRIEEGKADWVGVLSDFYKELEELIDRAKKTVPEFKSKLTEATDKKCPKCGAPMVVKMGRYGKFLACSNFPKCKYTEPITTNFHCPRKGCDGYLVEKRTRKGKKFYGCSNYPECNFASWDMPVSSPCPKCGAPTRFVRKGKKEIYCGVCSYTEKMKE